MRIHMVFEHDDQKPYEFIWFLIASGGALFFHHLYDIIGAVSIIAKHPLNS